MRIRGYSSEATMASAKCSSTCLLSGASTPANADFHVSIDRDVLRVRRKVGKPY